jgi:hypothetical protein
MILTLYILQVIVFLLGLAAIAQACKHAIFFSKSSTTLSWTMVAFMMEQVISSLGTLVFAANSLLGSLSHEGHEEWNNIDPKLAIFLRTVMFLAMIRSTSAMSNEIRKIQNGRN